MNMDELRDAVKVQSQKLGDRPNSIEYQKLYRSICKAAYELDDFPMLSGLESIWKGIQAELDFLKKDRESDAYKSPLSYFMYMVDGGFYPPPEVMLSLLRGFENYFDAGGDKSLDECFFGRKHKKKSSPAFYKAMDLKYAVFHGLFANPKARVRITPKPSIEESAEDFLTSIFGLKNSEIDPDTFVRGYRRWLKSGNALISD